VEKNIFRYVWSLSKGEQIFLLVMIALSTPFYFASLDIPKSIVSDAIQGRAFSSGNLTAPLFVFHIRLPQFLGGSSIFDFDGIQFERLPYLIVLSGMFLALVLINGAFKYVINVRKGALGERLLQRIRYDLFCRLMRFTPEALQHVRPAEAATIIKDEVEPIGGFVGDAFIQPVFLATQAATAMIFICLQSFWLGLIAAGVIIAQGVIIPRMRREQIRLGKQRQLQARALAGQIGEAVDGISAVQGHGATVFELRRISDRLSLIFETRYLLFKRKFAAKFMNNMLAQVTPFVFFLLGGYLALNGSLSIGQLVAVIAAYRDLPPPIKELIDWDQQRTDIEAKYDQIVQIFSTPELVSDGDEAMADITLAAGRLEVSRLRLLDQRGAVLLDSVSFGTTLPAHVALVGGGAADMMARVFGRARMQFEGSVTFEGQDLLQLPPQAVGRQIGYASSDPVLFAGTIRYNMLYGLMAREGRPPEPSAEMDDRILAALGLVGMTETVYRFGLNARMNDAHVQAIGDRIVRLRAAVLERLREGRAETLVEAFSPDLYNRNASIRENLLFGHVDGETSHTLLQSDAARAILDEAGVSDMLLRIGRDMAATMVDLFSDLPPGHFMFERFSFISGSDLPDFAAIVERMDREGPADPADVARLTRLSLDYVEARHRLGLLDKERMDRLVAARRALARNLPEELRQRVDFYDPQRVCRSAPLLDNVLFGKVMFGIADADHTVLAAVRDCIAAEGLEPWVLRLGLDYEVGNGGRVLSSVQRAAVSLARCLLKEPSVLILNGALDLYADEERAMILSGIRAFSRGRTVVAVEPDAASLDSFDLVVTFSGTRLLAANRKADAVPTRPERATA
jgi:putative ABC transport system ATP-binding protein